MKFVKMHGCGNDYVYLDGISDPSVAARIDKAGWVELVGRMSDRHKGIGSDGVIVLCPPTDAGKGGGAQVRMRMFNADGSESEMCGNGVRCVAKFAHDRLGVRARPMLVETGRGMLSIDYEVRDGKIVEATVDMGEPILDLAAVPVDPSQLTKSPNGHFIRDFKGVGDWRFVSMGNPHAVSFKIAGAATPREAIALIKNFGPRLEHHPAFPNRANIHFVNAPTRNEARVYTWERGAGMTQACGTGICAALVAGVLANHLDRETTMHALGGPLRIRWDEPTNHVFMTGEAVDICEGVWLGSA